MVEKIAKLSGKNLIKINGKHLFLYPLEASLNSKKIHKTFICTDDPKINNISEKKVLLKFQDQNTYQLTMHWGRCF